MSDFNESGELRMVEQDYRGRPAERAEQLRRHRDDGFDPTVRHGAGNTGVNHAATDDHLTVGELEAELRRQRQELGA